jgi:tetratricopeptide (TPR) repeat protein
MIADKPQNLITDARSVLSSRKFSDFHLNELRAALGTLEEHSGSHSKAKKLFRNALLAPTENTLSQVLKMGMVSIIPDFLIDNPPPKSFEAMARIAFKNGDWVGALAASNAWLQDEAYSGRPAILSSFILQIQMGDHQAALKVLDKGIKANPDDIVLKNNKIFSLACSGDTDAAKTQLASLKNIASPSKNPFIHATEGLIYYREGNTDLGRLFYQKAVDDFVSSNNLPGARLAIIYQAAEELKAFGKIRILEVDKIIESNKDQNDSGMKLALNRLNRIRKEVEESSPDS